ncbi:hypothetical protein L5F41_04925 [Aliarcobacter butzleri]|uniref:hypothetical protein n=1 Tax=Aliarcobacter butzleri TaxID=28197 RepID=UPI001EDB5701|nr:hypothetical protein [Aliarcobacter butzleri]MCG3701436.1 hypothetical protein [Aliarcobacter butzleri]
MSILDENSFDKFITKNIFTINDEKYKDEHSIKIRRDNELNILLNHESSTQYEQLEMNPKVIDTMPIFDIGKTTYTLKNVYFYSINESSNLLFNTSKIKAEAFVESIEFVSETYKNSEYIVEYIDNIPINHIWSDIIEKEIISKNIISIGDIEIEKEESASSGGSNGLILNIDNQEIYLIRGEEKSKKEYTDGFILYKGNPSKELRDKFRNIISFFIGRVMILLEESFYDIDWNLTSFKAFSPKKLMNGRAFKINTILPIKYNQIIDSERFSKHCNLLYQKYDLCDFNHISWLYWHAQCSALHTKCGELGATIEALQKEYINNNTKGWSAAIISKDKFKELKEKTIKVIDELDIKDEEKNILKEKLTSLNKLPQKMILQNLFKHLNYSINEDELKAWQGRNNSAHGNKNEYSIKETIKQINLLQDIFFKLIRLIADIDR